MYILICHTGVTVRTRFSMATIGKRGKKWQVQVRRNGCKHLSKTFHLKGDADKWARKNEIAVDRGDDLYAVAQLEDTSFRDLLIRYMKEIGSLVASVAINKQLPVSGGECGTNLLTVRNRFRKRCDFV